MRWRLICLATFFIVDTFLDNRLEASSCLKTSDRIAAFFQISWMFLPSHLLIKFGDK